MGQQRRGGGAFRAAGRRPQRRAEPRRSQSRAAGHARPGRRQRQPHDRDVRHEPRRQPRQDRVHGALVEHVRAVSRCPRRRRAAAVGQREDFTAVEYCRSA